MNQIAHFGEVDSVLIIVFLQLSRFFLHLLSIQPGLLFQLQNFTFLLINNNVKLGYGFGVCLLQLFEALLALFLKLLISSP